MGSGMAMNRAVVDSRQYHAPLLQEYEREEPRHTSFAGPDEAGRAEPACDV